LCSLPWPVKCPTQFCTSKKECNKLVTRLFICSLCQLGFFLGWFHNTCWERERERERERRISEWSHHPFIHSLIRDPSPYQLLNPKLINQGISSNPNCHKLEFLWRISGLLWSILLLLEKKTLFLWRILCVRNYLSLSVCVELRLFFFLLSFLAGVVSCWQYWQ
jgi:hypothetical protein